MGGGIGSVIAAAVLSLAVRVIRDGDAADDTADAGVGGPDFNFISRSTMTGSRDILGEAVSEFLRTVFPFATHQVESGTPLVPKSMRSSCDMARPRRTALDFRSTTSCTRTTTLQVIRPKCFSS